MKKFTFIIVFFALIIGGVLAWWINGTSAVNAFDKTQKPFSIKKGEGVKIIANNLKSAELIRDPIVFFLVVKQLGLDSKVQAGDFLLSPSQNAFDIARSLQTGSYDVRISIPEGKRAAEIAELLKDRLDSYQDNWRSNLSLNEGYLFPDTYFFSKDATIEQIISIMHDNFEKKYNSIPNVGTSRFTKDEIVKIASMVEREAKFQSDRPLVASVIINRLNAGMALDIDATIQYAIGTKEDWWPVLTDSGRNIVPNSPFNTYTHPGLPPKPISNPGYEVLNAVVNPANTSYLFYISDSKGTNHYSKTNEEHEANKRKYGL